MQHTELKMDAATVEYEGETIFTDGKGHISPVRVSIARSAVEHHGQVYDKALPPEVATVFIAAIERAGVPVASMLSKVRQLRELRPDLVQLANDPSNREVHAVPAWAMDPQPFVYVESWPPAHQPWPVYVAIGSDVVAEFYPTTMG